MDGASRPTESGSRPDQPGTCAARPDRRPAQPDSRPIHSGRRPADSGSRPIHSGRRPVDPGKPPVESGSDPLEPDSTAPRVVEALAGLGGRGPDQGPAPGRHVLRSRRNDSAPVQRGQKTEKRGLILGHGPATIGFSESMPVGETGQH